MTRVASRPQAHKRYDRTASALKLDSAQAMGYYGSYESKRSKKNNRIDDQDQQDAWTILQPASVGV